MSGEAIKQLDLAAAGTSRLDFDGTAKRKRPSRTVAKDDVLGQFSFAPATQTTVVTTTTTTTTNFPPIVIHGPRNVQDLDPVQYPLARQRTPDSLRRVQFTVGDRTALFREADDAIVTLNEVSLDQIPLA